jgi:hypothetical protein
MCVLHVDDSGYGMCDRGQHVEQCWVWYVCCTAIYMYVYLYVRQHRQPDVGNYNLMSLAAVVITVCLKQSVSKYLKIWPTERAVFPLLDFAFHLAFQNQHVSKMESVSVKQRGSYSVRSNCKSYYQRLVSATWILMIRVLKIENSCFCWSQHRRYVPTLSPEDWNRSSYQNTVLV